MDYYIPGCPPRPEMVLNAIIHLQKTIKQTPSIKRTRIAALLGVGAKAE